MKKIQTLFVAFILLAAGAFILAPVSPVVAAGALDTVCEANPGESEVCSNKDRKSSGGFVGAIVNTLLFLVGAISVISIIIGGILYVLSSGDSSNITKAKNTILYAIVGLVVSFLAYAIINWVFNLF